MVPAGGADSDWAFLHSVFDVDVQFLTVSSSWSHLQRRARKQVESETQRFTRHRGDGALSPQALLAQLARLVRITKPARSAATLGIVGVSARRHHHLI